MDWAGTAAPPPFRTRDRWWRCQPLRRLEHCWKCSNLRSRFATELRNRIVVPSKPILSGLG